MKCEDKLRALARRFSRATDLAIDADDVVQEALLALWSLSEKGYPVRDAEALLVKITKNICVSHYRKRHLDTETIVSDVFAGDDSASRRIEEQDAERLRERLYSQLTSSELEFTRMREERGCSLDEMSSESGRRQECDQVAALKGETQDERISKESMNMTKEDNITLEELEKAYLSDESSAEFDRLVARGISRRRNRLIWGTTLAAASLALILTLWPRGKGEGFNGLEIAEGIERILELDADGINSVTAKPDGDKVVLTALMNDGSRCSYIMSRENGASAVSITAINNLKNK